MSNLARQMHDQMSTPAQSWRLIATLTEHELQCVSVTSGDISLARTSRLKKLSLGKMNQNFRYLHVGMHACAGRRMRIGRREVTTVPQPFMTGQLVPGASCLIAGGNDGAVAVCEHQVAVAAHDFEEEAVGRRVRGGARAYLHLGHPLPGRRKRHTLQHALVQGLLQLLSCSTPGIAIGRIAAGTAFMSNPWNERE